MKHSSKVNIWIVDALFCKKMGVKIEKTVDILTKMCADQPQFCNKKRVKESFLGSSDDKSNLHGRLTLFHHYLDHLQRQTTLPVLKDFALTEEQSYTSVSISERFSSLIGMRLMHLHNSTL